MKKTIEAAVLTLMLTGILAATTTPLAKLAAGGPLPVPTTPVCMPGDQQCLDTANGKGSTPTQPTQPAPSFR